MVIQRIQSVYLLIAVILMGVFAFFPALSFQVGGKEFVYGALEAGKAGALHIDPLMFTLVVLIAVLALIDIFLYKNLQRQMTVCFVDIVISIAMLAAIGIQAYMLSSKHNAVELVWQWWLLLPVLAIIFMIMAHRAMSRDKKLLRDSDRLR